MSDLIIEEGKELAQPLGLNSLMHVNKASMKARVEVLLDNIHNGNIDPLEALIYAKKGNEIFKMLEANVRPYAEARQIQKGYKAFDCAVVEKGSPNQYDFSACEDSTYNKMIADLSELKEKIKERETFLKSLKEDVAMMDGEVIHPPVVTYGKLSLALTIE